MFINHSPEHQTNDKLYTISPPRVQKSLHVEDIKGAQPFRHASKDPMQHRPNSLINQDIPGAMPKNYFNKGKRIDNFYYDGRTSYFGGLAALKPMHKKKQYFMNPNHPGG
jgi:hypothetical protein